MQYTVITISSIENVTLAKRKDYCTKFWGTRREVVKKGFLTKFANAVQLTDEQKDDLYESIVMNPFKEEIASFHFKDPVVANKWKSFLSKIFPHLKINVKKGLKPTLEDWILSEIFMGVENTPVTVEFYLTKRPSKETINKIVELLEHLKQEKLYYLGKIYDRSTYDEDYKEGDHRWFFELDYHYKHSSTRETFAGTPFDGPELCSDCMKVVDQPVICKNCEDELGENLLFKVNV